MNTEHDEACSTRSGGWIAGRCTCHLNKLDAALKRNEVIRPRPDLVWWTLAIIAGMCIGFALIHYNPLGL